MKFQETPIQDVVLIEPQVFGDARGFFLESWQAQKFAAAGIAAISFKTTIAARLAMDLARFAFSDRAHARQAGASDVGECL